jgi:hypothetical protein
VTRDLAESDRWAAVRDAAVAWRGAGRIDDAMLERIVALFPDDRVRAGLAMRVLLAVFTVVAGFGVFGVLAAAGHEPSVALVVGIAAAIATELLVTGARRRGAGIEEGTTFLTLVMLAVGVTAALPTPHRSFEAALRVALAVALVVCAMVVWRWGMPTYAGIGTAALFLLLAQTPAGPPLWLLVPSALGPLLLRGARSARLPSAHRESCRWALVVSLAALYVALNLASADQHWIAHLDTNYTRWATDTEVAAWLRALHAIGTAGLPLLVIGAGVRRRERILLWSGTVMALGSLVTLRYYVHLAPLWIELLGGGALAIAVALLLRRWLDAGSGHERRGFTAEPGFSAGDRERLIEVAAVLVAFTPQARPTETKPAFEAGGGEFGGGGASDSF